MKNLILGVICGVIGFTSVSMGYGITTTPYWFITIPTCIATGWHWNAIWDKSITAMNNWVLK